MIDGLFSLTRKFYLELNGPPNLCTTPARTLRAIFQNDPGRKKFGANAIGFGEILALLCRSAISNQRLNSIGRKLNVHLSTGRYRLQEGLRIALQQTKQTSERFQLSRQRWRLPAIDL